MKNKTLIKRVIIANICVSISIMFIAPFFIDFSRADTTLASFYLNSSFAMLGWYTGRIYNINKLDISWYILFFLCLAGVLSVVYVLMNLLEASYLAKVYVLSGITFVGGLYFIYKLLKKNK
ncbi:MAG: hypothetical protein LBC98_03135 [Prevotellaceae bacterium]|jgi:hypothetical protein|nr:hypothetical protein [Prevotellaceae bacterium]